MILDEIIERTKADLEIRQKDIQVSVQDDKSLKKVNIVKERLLSNHPSFCTINGNGILTSTANNPS